MSVPANNPCGVQEQLLLVVWDHVGHVQVKQALPASTHCASSWQSVRTMARTLPEFRMAPWTTPCSHQKLHVNSSSMLPDGRHKWQQLAVSSHVLGAG